MKSSAIALIGLTGLLAACSPDTREADIHKCIAQSPQTGGPGMTSEEEHDAIGAEVADCMKGLGYRHDLADEKCIDDVDFNRYCYVKRRAKPSV